jgi:hypothetical protein
VVAKRPSLFNEVRPHPSLEDLTPNEFVARAGSHQATGRDAALQRIKPIARPIAMCIMHPYQFRDANRWIFRNGSDDA